MSDIDWLRSESVFVLCGAVLDIKEAHSLRVSGVFDDFIGINVGMQVYFYI